MFNHFIKDSIFKNVEVCWLVFSDSSTQASYLIKLQTHFFLYLLLSKFSLWEVASDSVLWCQNLLDVADIDQLHFLGKLSILHDNTLVWWTRNFTKHRRLMSIACLIYEGIILNLKRMISQRQTCKHVVIFSFCFHFVHPVRQIPVETKGSCSFMPHAIPFYNTKTNKSYFTFSFNVFLSVLFALSWYRFLLFKRFRVRFPILLWSFSLEKTHSMVCTDWMLVHCSCIVFTLLTTGQGRLSNCLRVLVYVV
jgi:hypothetical protein